MRNVEAWIAYKLPPGPYLLEHTVKKGNVFRNIVAWCGGPLPIEFSSCSDNASAHFPLPQLPPQFTNINHDNVMLSMIGGLTQAQELTLKRTTLLEEKYEEMRKCMENLNAKVSEYQASKDCHEENTLREATISPLDQKYEDIGEKSKETDYEDVKSYVSNEASDSGVICRKKTRNRKKNRKRDQPRPSTHSLENEKSQLSPENSPSPTSPKKFSSRQSKIYRRSVLHGAALAVSSLPLPKNGSLRQAAQACVQRLQADSALPLNAPSARQQPPSSTMSIA